ncbi:alpha/beta hydrolase [Streptomyces sp. MB09-01]|uniref:alpha/beta hydrolase n=1 Tax=Streptomyces sp. MB09-01 TaxID=3028666 RepID=UPI0029BE32FB|nr:alpha/beta hydrolase [Streptomyces sp. MB09-01]MDX3539625.1 alpha/beta hydrolase [Streptomyces sp. MB09-01]
MAAVVLVHGLYHRPEHFAVLAKRLRTAGTEVVVPELHRGSLSADTAAVQAAIEVLPEPPVVLGHSYGGSVITGVHGAGHLVYLAAFVLDVGESAAGMGGASPQLQDAIVPEPDGSTRLHPDRAIDALYGDCPEPLAARAVGLLRAQAPGCGRGVPERHSWKHTPSTYVVCALDRAIDPGLQRRMASRCTDVREWQTGHSPFVGRPDLIVELVLELVAPPRTPPGPNEGVASTRRVR